MVKKKWRNECKNRNGGILSMISSRDSRWQQNGINKRAFFYFLFSPDSFHSFFNPESTFFPLSLILLSFLSHPSLSEENSPFNHSIQLQSLSILSRSLLKAFRESEEEERESSSHQLQHSLENNLVWKYIMNK